MCNPTFKSYVNNMFSTENLEIFFYEKKKNPIDYQLSLRLLSKITISKFWCIYTLVLFLEIIFP